MNKSVAFVVPYPVGFAPSQRFRFEQYISHLNKDGFSTDFFPFLSLKDFQLIYKQGKFLNKFLATIKGFVKRFFLLIKLGKYDIVFIHREASPIGPPIFEWIITKIFKKKTIYDFDDAIWMENTSESNKFVSSVKRHSKVEKICKWSDMIFCGNDYLKAFASQFNSNTLYVPTTIDTENLHNQTKKHSSEKVTIGWTGTHTTAKYLNEVISPLQGLQKKHNINIKLICNKDPEINQITYEFIQWKKETEIEDLLNFDIGIMPLLDNDWAKGKCGFKALQYMSLEIPAVVSPVGVNNKIITDSKNGFHANDINEWNEKFELLINNKDLRIQLGREGRKTVFEYFSVSAHRKNYLSFFNQLSEQ